jgi:hypothetical protein
MVETFDRFMVRQCLGIRTDFPLNKLTHAEHRALPALSGRRLIDKPDISGASTTSGSRGLVVAGRFRILFSQRLTDFGIVEHFWFSALCDKL